jgi:hypothetical protein
METTVLLCAISRSTVNFSYNYIRIGNRETLKVRSNLIEFSQILIEENGKAFRAVMPPIQVSDGCILYGGGWTGGGC